MSDRCIEHRGTSDEETDYRYLGSFRLPREPLITIPVSTARPPCPVCALLAELRRLPCKGA
jgi:hypothetical protein